MSHAVNANLLPKSPRAAGKTEGKPVSTLQNRAFHHLYCPHPWRELPPEPRTCWGCQAPGLRKAHPQLPAPRFQLQEPAWLGSQEKAQILSGSKPAAAHPSLKLQKQQKPGHFIPGYNPQLRGGYRAHRMPLRSPRERLGWLLPSSAG